MKRHPLATLVLVALLAALGAGIALAGPPAWPLAASGAPTVVSYQGQVTVDGVPYNGKGYLKFAIVNAGGGTTYWSNDGTASGEPVNAVELTVTNGLFTVLLGDTGMNALTADVFDGSERYLRVWFASGTAGPFAQLTPDRRIAAVPYALQATSADTLDGKHLAELVQANGTLQAGLNADQLDGQHAAAFAAAGHNHAGSYWQLGGNAGTTGSNFLGTTDGQPLELRVDGARALRLEPNATSPNVIGGYSTNSVKAGVAGAAIGGGGNSLRPNSVTADYGTVSGGERNRAEGEYATVAGGFANVASGAYATAAGGKNNYAAGAYSLAAGSNANATHDGAFVWGDSSGVAVLSEGPNTFVVRASGGVYLYTNSRLTSGMKLASGGSSWNEVSDRAAKENLAPVDQQALLARLAAIPISTWNYTTQDPAIRHVGPMAQDFNALLPDLGGEGETYINTLDADGVALAAIQGLYQRAQDQAARIDQLEAENAALRAQMASIEARLAALEQGR